MLASLLVTSFSSSCLYECLAFGVERLLFGLCQLAELGVGGVVVEDFDRLAELCGRAAILAVGLDDAFELAAFARQLHDQRRRWRPPRACSSRRRWRRARCSISSTRFIQGGSWGMATMASRSQSDGQGAKNKGPNLVGSAPDSRAMSRATWTPTWPCRSSYRRTSSGSVRRGRRVSTNFCLPV